MTRPPDKAAVGHIDETDEAIIGLLQQDGRQTYGELAPAVQLSEAATRQRVNKLRATGTLRIVAVTDPIALGLRTVAMVGIRTSGNVRTVAAQLAAVDDIEYVVISSGSFDILLEVICENERRLLDIVNDEIRSIEGVLQTEIFNYLHIEKQVFAWGGRTERTPAQSRNPAPAPSPPSNPSAGIGARQRGPHQGASASATCAGQGAGRSVRASMQT